MIVSLTHEHDLDGLGSQAIIKRYFDLNNKHDSKNLILLYAQYIDFSDKIKSILNSDKLPKELIISDIGFNEGFMEIFPLMKKAFTLECRISWFDHHIVDPIVKEKIRLMTSIYVNDEKKCAAEIVQNHFLPDDDIAIRIAELARDSDFKPIKIKLANNLQSIIGFNRGEEKLQERRHMVDLLSKGKFTHKWFDSQLKNIQDWIEEQSNLALNTATKYQLDEKKEFIISFSGIGGGKINDILREKYPQLFAYIGIDIRYGEIIIHSDHINCRDFAMSFGGGGHEERAGFKYPNIFSSQGVLNQEFIKDVKKSIRKSYNE
jgi:oligoribonuclease NrnB/cAMP/cGMP phosphodiesterase (DHH superfamily)